MEKEKESVLGGRAWDQDAFRSFTADLLYCRSFLGRNFLKENIKYENCTPAHKVKMRVIQEHKVKYFSKGIVLILMCLLLSEKKRHLLDGLAINKVLDKF